MIFLEAFVLENKNIVVAGGGHAGLEAAFAISRMGGGCTIVTMDSAAIGRLSCNPAMGGLGKSHLVKEIDALGGIMGYCSDLAGIQFKMLNKTKGRAVWANRIQVDKKTYPVHIKRLLDKNQKIKIVEGEVVDFCVKNNKVSKVELKSGLHIPCSALIVTCGTFLNGLIHIGEKTFPAGRMGEKPAKGLTESLQSYGFKAGRLKTGTPPRLLSKSINWSLTKKSPGDKKPTPFSLYTKRPLNIKQEPCYIVDTNQKVHNVINNNIKQSAIFSGKIKGIGPRYCPSIEDKIFRFSDNPSHMLFLEPEWKQSEQIYLNGFSTSLPEKTQLDALRKIDALKNVELIRPGYAIEYDYSPPYQLKNTLMSKGVDGLFFAGQINGTSGYEEAAAQGLVAGINSFLYINKKEPFILSRQESYIGVMIDDLITTHLDEPYRMFTSRAEHRLFLRSDNCHSRLFAKAANIGLLMKKQKMLCEKLLGCEELINSWVNNNRLALQSKSIKYKKFLKRPNVSVFDFIPKKFFKKQFFDEAAFNVETAIKYEGYIENELKRIKTAQRLEHLKIPKNFKYSSLQGLSNESKMRLNKVLPQTLGQASRISGIRPTDITLIGLQLNKKVSRET
tara:strand:- start:1519 stop:3369 length:1851 start_codon:yes stop_codon:yes gene_type:complete